MGPTVRRLITRIFGSAEVEVCYTTTDDRKETASQAPAAPTAPAAEELRAPVPAAERQAPVVAPSRRLLPAE